MSNPRHDKVLVIVEETVQHVYLMDPDSTATVEVFHVLPKLLMGEALETLPMAWDKPPTILGHRAKKGAPMPLLMTQKEEAAKFSRFTGVTIVIPDENGDPSEEFKYTTTTMTRKPVKK
jgi:hypothetical protein